MIICGAGGHAKVVIDILGSIDIKVIGIIGKQESISSLKGIPIVEEYNPTLYPNSKLIVATGDNKLRQKIAGEVQHSFATAIHPSATISQDVRIGKGTVVVHQAVIQTGTTLGDHVIINTSASVDHDCTIGDFAHISPNVTLCGGVSVGEGSLVGAGSVIIPNKTVGKWSVIGAGSVVIDDIPDFCMAAGNPARIIKQFEHE